MHRYSQPQARPGYQYQRLGHGQEPLIQPGVGEHRWYSQPPAGYQYQRQTPGREVLLKPGASPHQQPWTPASSAFSPDPKSEYFPLTGAASPNPQEKGDHRYRRLSRRCRCDCAALTLCLGIWILIAGAIASFIFFSKAKRNEAGWVDGNTVALAFVVALGCSAVAAILNDALVDRCWRRIRAQALRGSMKGSHLRAANFELVAALKRIVTGKITKRELATLFSYTLLRWGTLSGLPIIQLTVHYERNPTNDNSFFTHIQERWVPIPIILHMVSVILALAICGLPPWSILLNKYDEKVIHAAYQQYLDVVPYGSAASSDQIATLLDKTNNQPHDFTSLAINHRPGLQLKTKTRGILSGTLIILAMPSIIYTFQHTSVRTAIPIERFIYSYGIDITAAGYGFALSFAIWTLGLEGLTSRPRSDTNYLGTTSGLMLFVKACRQRKPARVFLLYWVFWLHSGLMRLLLFATSWALSVQHIVPAQQTISDAMWRVNSLSKWVFWPAIIWGWMLLPFGLWLVASFQAPLTPFDGWRHAKIVEGAATVGKGRYGVEGPVGQGRAVWGRGTRAFGKERLL